MKYKYSIAQKECSETCYWLDLLYSTGIIIDKEFQSIDEDCIEFKILASTIPLSTSKKKPLTSLYFILNT